MTLTSKVYVLVTGCKAKGFRNISSLAHRSVSGQMQTSEKDGALLKLAGLRPTILWLRPASTATNKNTNALSEAKDTDGGQLTLGQKGYEKERSIKLHSEWITWVVPSKKRHVSHMEYIKDGINYMRMKFYIKGPSRSGTVHLEVRELPLRGVPSPAASYVRGILGSPGMAPQKPPNVLVFTDEDVGSNQLRFHAVKETLSMCLSPDNYAIYPLSENQVEEAMPGLVLQAVRCSPCVYNCRFIHHLAREAHLSSILLLWLWPKQSAPHRVMRQEIFILAHEARLLETVADRGVFHLVPSPIHEAHSLQKADLQLCVGRRARS
ncbi:hypothetical protein HPB50_023343 [Hyalomma asiaticum]|uniref:Uncharacterized protein n=1 Tax=Hyalomma asiaticum TaxID=266040 RepID=A0ACB7TQH0_HYAAI|nr:hypothetical protein HPB50_023343 [Hyalomma asiaticum]